MHATRKLRSLSFRNRFRSAEHTVWPGYSTSTRATLYVHFFLELYVAQTNICEFSRAPACLVYERNLHGVVLKAIASRDSAPVDRVPCSGTYADDLPMEYGVVYTGIHLSSLGPTDLSKPAGSSFRQDPARAMSLKNCSPCPTFVTFASIIWPSNAQNFQGLMASISAIKLPSTRRPEMCLS